MSEYPPLRQKCGFCDGKKFVLQHHMNDLPDTQWCPRCRRRGWEPTSFGDEVLAFIRANEEDTEWTDPLVEHPDRRGVWVRESKVKK